MSTQFRGAFLGFSFNGVHSSTLKIVRINTGSRADLPLTPQFKDNTVEKTGGYGLHYFDTQILQQTFTINFAYDNLTEEDVKNIRQLFRPETVGALIFDEAPYKEYTVKISSQPKLSYLVFGEGTTNRLYKGEGALAFTAYYPYAHSPFGKKWLENYSTDWTLEEIAEWSAASGLINWSNLYNNNINNAGPTITRLANLGDIPTPLKFNFTINQNSGYVTFEIEGNNIPDNQKIILDLSCLPSINVDTTYIFDSKIKLITEAITGIVHNEIIAAGDFLKVPVGTGSTLSMTSSTYSEVTNIEYDYLYL